MYQKIAFLLAFVLCMPAYAAQTKNTMKMVSYFPVPYVAYDTVSANNAMDIGVLTQCEMAIKKGTSNLGGSACSLYLYGDPNAADLNSGLLNVTAGKLDLNSNVANARIVSKKVQIGKDMTTVGGWLDIGIPSGKAKDYDALYISSLKNTGSSFRVTSKETGAKVNSFHMFNEISNDFPGCAGTVTWKELELAADVDTNKTYTDVYLVCDGSGEVPPPQECEAPNGLSYTESCPEGQEGNITFTWQGEPVCNYKETNTCKEVCQPTKGQSYTENCPSGQSGTITYTWNQSTCSYNSTNNCVEETCTIVSKYLGSQGYMTAEEIKSADTCDGSLEVRFDTSNHNLSKGGSCIDIVQTGSWMNPPVSGSWSTGSAKPRHNYWWSGASTPTGISPGSYSNCLQTVQNQVWGKGSLPDANEMCKLQCPGASHGENNCNTNPCIFHYNCRGNQGWNSSLSGANLWGGSLDAISCTEHKLTCNASDSTNVVSTVAYQYTCE